MLPFNGNQPYFTFIESRHAKQQKKMYVVDSLFSSCNPQILIQFSNYLILVFFPAKCISLYPALLWLRKEGCHWHLYFPVQCYPCHTILWNWVLVIWCRTMLLVVKFL